ncbi:hypothetical protein QVD17_13661 [Tagetes erecta]|uniref:Uncharacterized protein n=1 Tax=Tagetes erecta TaxID=13708 RepID=A0AAD8L0Y0_TARER|nr:hypothetical protein QVD17_13661 [Tagetes erecta]
MINMLFFCYSLPVSFVLHFCYELIIGALLSIYGAYTSLLLTIKIVISNFHISSLRFFSVACCLFTTFSL